MVFFLLSFGQKVLMMYNVENFENLRERGMVFEIVTRFPNFWVRKLVAVKENWANYGCL
jgi:hypothetical protein